MRPTLLRQPHAVAAVEAAVSTHVGRPWRATSYDDLTDRSSHEAGIWCGDGTRVFVKADGSDDAADRLTSELAGLRLLAERAGVSVPGAVGPGVVAVQGGALMLLEAVPARPREDRTPEDWASIGRTLAALHQVHGDGFGLKVDVWFGPVHQDNRPVPGGTWADFYAERRLLPRLRGAVDAGALPQEVAEQVERVAVRLPHLAGPEPRPALLHGDAQANNWLSGPDGAVVIDPAPHFGHPELDLSALGVFHRVPPVALDAYREVLPMDGGFDARRELWRLAAYLAVVEVSGGNPFGRTYLRRLAEAVRRYA